MDRSTSTEPLGGFVHYAGRNALTVNCIMIDSDQPEYWLNHTYLAGAFCNDCGGYCPYEFGQIQNVLTTHSLSLNNYGKFLTISKSNFPDVGEAPVYRNSVSWASKAWYGNGNHTGDPNSIFGIRGDIIIDQCTFGEFTSPAGNISFGTFINGWEDSTASGDIITNSILYSFNDFAGPGGLFYDFNTVRFNNIYGTGPINVHGTEFSNIITTNPTTNGLSYITRIENNSPLITSGEGGKRIGADLTYMYGKSGTMYGENGYSGETSTKMWPFPNEDLIRQHMRAYSYQNLSGARGFCADNQTLTKYVWEYLGNPIPSDIYTNSLSSEMGTPINLRIEN
jgi:hypothetical protein